MQITDLLFIEIFAGSGKLTKAAQVWQFETMAIDKTVQRSAGTRISLLDLSDPDQATALLDLIRQESHRMRKETQFFQQNGRRCATTFEITSTTTWERWVERTGQAAYWLANQVYSFTAEVMELCISLNILCSVENPENSLFWEYPDIKRVIGKGFFTEFHNKRLASRRCKRWVTMAYTTQRCKLGSLMLPETT